MSSLEGLTLFTTGIRVTILIFLIITLLQSLRMANKRSHDALASMAKNPKIMLGAVLTLLAVTVIETTVEIIDHFKLLR